MPGGLTRVRLYVYGERLPDCGADALWKLYDTTDGGDETTLTAVDSQPMFTSGAGEAFYGEDTIPSDAEGVGEDEAFDGDGRDGIGATRVRLEAGPYIDGQSVTLRAVVVDPLEQYQGSPTDFSKTVSCKPLPPSAFSWREFNGSNQPVFNVSPSANPSNPTFDLWRATTTDSGDAAKVVSGISNGATTATDTSGSYSSGTRYYYWLAHTSPSSSYESDFFADYVGVEYDTGTNVAIAPNVPTLSLSKVAGGYADWKVAYVAAGEDVAPSAMKIYYTTDGSTPDDTDTLLATVNLPSGVSNSAVWASTTGTRFGALSDGTELQAIAVMESATAGSSQSAVATVIIDAEGPIQAEAFCEQEGA